MIEWFNKLDPLVQAAVITGLATVVGAVVTGIFKSKSSKKHIKIKQKQNNCYGGTQIGIQNNYNNNTTIQFGDTTADNGTLIIDGGDAFNNSGVRYEPAQNKENKGESENV